MHIWRESKTNTLIKNSGNVWTETSPQNIHIGKDAHTLCYERKAKWSPGKPHNMSSRTARLHNGSRKCWGKLRSQTQNCLVTSHLGVGLDGVTGRSRHFGILMPASCRTKGNLTKQFGIHTLWFLTPCPWWWQSFISNCPELEAAKMHFCRGAGKLWSFWTAECHLAVKRNELSSHNKSQRCLKCIVLGDRSRSEKVASCVIPSLTF